MRTLRSSGLTGIALLSLFGAACGDVDPFGDSALEVSWAVAPLGCAELGVEEVEVTLKNTNHQFRREFPCAARRGELQGLPPGTYELGLKGVNDAGETLFGATGREVFLRPDEVTRVPVVDLVALPARLRVTWFFENQRVCGANGVDEVELAVFDHAYYEVTRGTFDCDLGAVSVDGLRAGEVWVQLRGVGADKPFEGLAATGLKQGGESSVDVALQEVSLHW